MKTTREEAFYFIVEYVLNRANTANSLEGDRAAKEAIKAWEVIDKYMTNVQQ